MLRRIRSTILVSTLLVACAATESGGTAGSSGQGAGGTGGGNTGGGNTGGGPVPDAGRDAPEDPSFPAGFPLVHDLSGAPRAHVISLVQRAIDGLGFPASNGQGPRAEDRIFVGRYYLAWIDQTGFLGKMNGFWRLNGQDGDALDFVVTDPDGRPVNFFAVAEDGDGRWPPGYPGAEHVEFPNRTPEANDNPSCAATDWCNQYGVNEAADITNPAIPWWSSCNVGAPGYDSVVAPVIEQAFDGGHGLKLIYETPLVKVADGDRTYDGDACNQDYLFADGVRRRVYLRLGYELLGDKDHFDRTMQIVNPAENPVFSAPMSLIGGFVITAWPNPHYLKRIHRYLRPEGAGLRDDTHDLNLEPGVWRAHQFPPGASDEVFGWLGQPVSFSDSDSFVIGRSTTLAHVGPSDNVDVGFCFCTVHGGLELGGGLIHGGVSLPIVSGTSTIEARRRLTFPAEGPGSAVFSRVYEAETDLSHSTGAVDADGWSASTAANTAGHLAYGPYAVDWGGGAGQAVFHVMIDDNTASDDLVVTLDVYDATAAQVIGQRAIHRRQFRDRSVYDRFAVNFDLQGRAGHQMETRVVWLDNAYIRLDKVVVKLTEGQ